MNTATTPRNKMTGFAMRGSVDISNMENYPEAKYWQMGAKWAKDKIYEMCPDDMSDHIAKVLDAVWNDQFTWMEICLQTEKTLETMTMIEALKAAVVIANVAVEEADPRTPSEQDQDADWLDEMATRESVRP